MAVVRVGATLLGGVSGSDRQVPAQAAFRT
jgi:hypothetical protein